MATSVDDAAKHLAARVLRERARAEARAAALRARLPDARRVLAAHGAGRVVLFGSLATGRVTDESDVDLAVEGLPADGYFAVLAELMSVLGSHVDLVRIEEAGETLKQRIADEGVEL